MTRKNQNNVDKDNKGNLAFDCGHKKWLVISPVVMVYNKPKHYYVWDMLF